MLQGVLTQQQRF